MSTENTTVETQEVDLDTFAAELFGQKEAAPVETNTEVEKDNTEESDADEDTQADAADTSAPDDDDVSDEEEVIEAPKPKKNRFQERIDELNGKFRDTERKLNEALAELAKKNTPEPTPAPKVEESTGPKPTDLKEDGTEKYPLGEFDPAYLRDFVNHTLNEERKVREQREQQDHEQKEREAAANALQEGWNTKLVSAKERYPDFQEKGEQMLSVFENIDQAYGEYLTNTIMDMEFGPDVFYYLSNNVDEAQKIVQSGAKKATIALGRLEAKFAFADEEKQKARPKVSEAPPPPPTNKGSAVAQVSIRGDEKDINLDDFSRALFKKQR